MYWNNDDINKWVAIDHFHSHKPDNDKFVVILLQFYTIREAIVELSTVLTNEPKINLYTLHCKTMYSEYY